MLSNSSLCIRPTCWHGYDDVDDVVGFSRRRPRRRRQCPGHRRLHRPRRPCHHRDSWPNCSHQTCYFGRYAADAIAAADDDDDVDSCS